MSSVLNAIVKLPRYDKILASNGIDENKAVVLDKKEGKRKKQQHDYYIRNKQRWLDYYHKYYQNNRDSILTKKKIYNDKNKERTKSIEGVTG